MLKKILSGASISLIAKISNAFFNFLCLTIAARILTVNDFGYFSLILAILPFIALISLIGTDYAALFYIPKRRIVSSNYYKTIISCVIMIIIITLFLIITLIIIKKEIIIDQDYNLILNSLIILLPLQVLIVFSRVLNQAKMNFFKSNFPEYILKPLIFFLCLLYCFFNDNSSLQVVIKIYIFSFVATALISAIWILKDLKGCLLNFGLDKEIIKEAPKYSLVQLLNQGNLFLIPIIISYFLTVDDVGYFRSSQQTSSLISFILVSVNIVLAPIVSQLYSENKLQKLKELFIVSTKWIMSFGAVISIFCIINAESIMLMFGEEYVSKSFIFQIMVLGQFINAAVGPSGFLLLMTQNQSSVIKATIIQLIFTIFITIFAIKNYGLTGATVGMNLSLIVFNIILFYYVWKKLRINAINREYIITLCIFIFSILISLILKNVLNEGFITLVSINIIAILVFSCMYYLLSMDEKEKNYLTNFLNKNKSKTEVEI
jgi:O-antigen/teichoic acid export membrane protein